MKIAGGAAAPAAGVPVRCPSGVDDPVEVSVDSDCKRGVDHAGEHGDSLPLLIGATDGLAARYLPLEIDNDPSKVNDENEEDHTVPGSSFSLPFS